VSVPRGEIAMAVFMPKYCIAEIRMSTEMDANSSRCRRQTAWGGNSADRLRVLATAAG
jgi:hypothetical protein